MSIAELGLVGKPTLLVPSPHVAEDHQTKNARSVLDRGGAVLIPDDRIVDTLGAEVRALLEDREACTSLSEALARTARPDAADRVVDQVLSVLSSSSPAG